MIKSKVLRLTFPAEVNSEKSVAKRSTTTGHLLISMPKCNPMENILDHTNRNTKATVVPNNTQTKDYRRSGLNQDMFKAASKSLVGSVCIKNLVVGKHGKHQSEEQVDRFDMTEVCTTRSGNGPIEACDTDSSGEPPLPF